MGSKGSHKVTMNWVEVDKGGGWGGHGMGEGGGRRGGSGAEGLNCGYECG